MSQQVAWDALESLARSGHVKHALGDEWFVSMIRVCKDLHRVYNDPNVTYPTKITILDYVHQYPVSSRSDVLKLLEHAVIFSRLDLSAQLETKDGLVYTVKLFQKGDE